MKSEFTLYQNGIFNLLKRGKPASGISREEFFYEAIVGEATAIGDQFGCSIEVNEKRLFEAQDYWEWDLRAMSYSNRIDGPAPVEPCEFKHAAFLTYWLRRRVFIEQVRRQSVTHIKKERMDFFCDYAVEISAFLIGVHLCSYFLKKKKVAAVAKNHDKVINLPSESKIIDFSMTCEYATLLRHKNVSPHALYLGFKSLLNMA